MQKQYLELSYFFENALNSCLSLGNTFVYSDCLKGVTWTKFRWVRILHEQSKLFLCFVPLLNILILIFLNSLSISLLIKLSLSNCFQAPFCQNLRCVKRRSDLGSIKPPQCNLTIKRIWGLFAAKTNVPNLTALLASSCHNCTKYFRPQKYYSKWTLWNISQKNMITDKK